MRVLLPAFLLLCSLTCGAMSLVLFDDAFSGWEQVLSVAGGVAAIALASYFVERVLEVVLE